MSTLAAVVAYDKAADLKEGRYYACIFERAASTSAAGLRGTSKLLMKGSHQKYEADAIIALLNRLSRDVGNIIAADLRTFQMGDVEWRASRDFTTRSDDGGARAGSSNGGNSRFGTRLAQLARKEELPPAYEK